VVLPWSTCATIVTRRVEDGAGKMDDDVDDVDEVVVVVDDDIVLWK